MKYAALFFIILSICLTSCDSRTSHGDSLKKAISEFNDKQLQLDIITITPENYTEIVTDTLIADAFNVHIKNYSVMDKNILTKTQQVSNQKTIYYHRIFESEIAVATPQKTVFSTLISTEDFKTNHPFWDRAILQHVWVNQEASTTTNVAIDIAFEDPKTKAYKLYQMSVDAFGIQQLFLKEEHI